MIRRPTKQNVESFLDTVAKHLTSGDWQHDDESVSFGPEGDPIGLWEGTLVFGEEGREAPVGISLVHEEYADGEIAAVEQAIALLEGLGYEAEDRPRSRRRS